MEEASIFTIYGHLFALGAFAKCRSQCDRHNLSVLRQTQCHRCRASIAQPKVLRSLGIGGPCGLAGFQPKKPPLAQMKKRSGAKGVCTLGKHRKYSTSQEPTCTGTNSGLERDVSRNLTASSATNFPMTNARLRLVVIWKGIESTPCTNSGALVPPRDTFTTNLMFVITVVNSSFLTENG
jgi:hypothetical protein